MCSKKKKKKKIAFKLNFKVKAYYSVSSNLQNTNEENNINFFLWTIGLDQEGNEYEKKKFNDMLSFYFKHYRLWKRINDMLSF